MRGLCTLLLRISPSVVKDGVKLKPASKGARGESGAKSGAPATSQDGWMCGCVRTSKFSSTPSPKLERVKGRRGQWPFRLPSNRAN